MNTFDIWEYLGSAQTPNKYTKSVKDILDWYGRKKIYDMDFHENKFGSAIKVTINNRYMIVYKSMSLNLDKYPCLIYFHGLGQSAWEAVFDDTNWKLLSNKNNFIVVYAMGTACGSNIDKRNGFNIKNPKEEYVYVKDMIKELINNFDVDPSKIYLVGFSNGSMMVTITMVYHSEGNLTGY